MTPRLSLPSPRPTVTAVVAGCLLLAGCGSESQDDPAAEPTASVTPGPTEGPLDPAQVETFTASNLALDGEGTATALEPGDVRAWLTPRAPDELVAEVEDAVEQAAAAGDEAYGVVLAVGCDAPERWQITRADGEVAVTVVRSRTTTQCLVPTTWLAVASVDGGE